MTTPLTSARPTVDLLDPRLPRRRSPPGLHVDARARTDLPRRSTASGASRRMEHVREVERRASEFVSSRGYRSRVVPRRDLDDLPGRPTATTNSGCSSPTCSPAGRWPTSRPVRARWSFAALANVRGLARVRGRRHDRRPPARRGDLPTCSAGRRDHWRDLRSWSERLMRVDSLHRDRDAHVRCDQRHARDRRADRTRRSRRAVAPRPAMCCVGGPTPRSTAARCRCSDINSELGLVVPGGAETTRTIAGPLADPAQRAQRPVGAAGRRAGLDPDRCRGAVALGHATEQHVPHRRHADDDRWRRIGRGRPARPGVPVGQPRCRMVHRPVRGRPASKPEPTRGVRLRPAPLPGRARRPAATAGGARGDDQPLHRPAPD